MSDYATFLKQKHRAVKPSGFDVSDSEINPNAFDWQRAIIKWACRRGRAALWEDCGLTKTFQQLEWARLVCERTGGQVLVLVPLAVAPQTLREVSKFSIQVDAAIVADQSQAVHQVNITNYERLHLFDPLQFVGIVLDESSILKSYSGSTKKQLCEAFARTPYRLCCTATPAPNDFTEIGNHAEFLGTASRQEMLAMYFVHDSNRSSEWRLKRHGAGAFWKWVSEWAICIEKPGDIGFANDGFDLPPLNIWEHLIEVDAAPAGMLFDPGKNVSATSVHQEKRRCLKERAEFAAGLVNGNSDTWTVWCDTDYESDSLKAVIPDAVDVRGSHPTHVKEERLNAFSLGGIRVMLTEPEIGGFGLNWQHCHKMTWFAGYSYERWYQSVRRLWRFGQVHPVDCHIIMSANEESIKKTMDQKAAGNQEMRSEMVHLMKAGTMNELFERKPKEHPKAKHTPVLPAWVTTKQGELACQ